MAFSLTPSAAFVKDVTTVTAAVLNAWRTNIARAIDGTGGGDYIPSARVNIDGSGLGSNDALLDGVVSLTGSMTLSGSAARMNLRVDVGTLGNAAADMTVANDVWIVTAAIGGGDKTYTLRHTGTVPEVGSVVTLKSQDVVGASQILVKREDTTLLATFGPTQINSCSFVYSAANTWVPLAWTSNVTPEI